MQRQESINRDIEGYKLTIILTPKKIIIRALEKESSALYACQFKAGSLPENIIFIYQNEENFFQAIISEENIRISKERLIIGYKVFRNNQAIQRQIVVPLVKMEADQFESLQNRVAALESQVEKFSTIEVELHETKMALLMLQQRTNFFYYYPGQFKPLILDVSNNPALYKLRQNFLYGKPRKQKKQPSSISLSYCLISNQPINEEEKLFSYKVTVTETQESGKIFIGLCAKKEKQINSNCIFNQENSVQQSDYEYIGKNCKLYLRSYNQRTREYEGGGIGVKVGDEIIQTINLQNCSITWFKNGVSLERTYFERPTANVYPFIYLSQNTEVTL